MDAVTLALIKSMAGNGGGGGLPALTSSDDGKILQVDRNASAGDVIVPQQSVSVTTSEKTFNNADASLFSNGTVVIVRISAGPNYNRVATVSNGAVSVMGPNGASLTISKNGDDITYVGSKSFNATITVSKAVFDPEFRLVNPGKSDEFIVTIVDNDGSISLEQDYNDIYRAYSSGKRIVLDYTPLYGGYIAKVNCEDMLYSPAPSPKFSGANILIFADGSVKIYKCVVKSDNTFTVDTYEFTITPAS